MGYMRHHAIVITGMKDRVEAAHVQAVRIFGDAVTAVTPEQTNGYCSFLVAPDGSKEWWAESDSGNERRETFKAWLIKTGGLGWVEVQFDDDENDVRVTAGNGFEPAHPTEER